MVTVIVTIAIFMVMITFHELGHFVSAKLLGVAVPEFSVGMGPAIFKRKGKKTLYALRIFPIGGYCRLEGEDEKSDDPEAFTNQKLWKRFIIVASGAIINLLMGFVLFMIVIKMMSPIPTNVIETVDERSYLAQAGVMPGDRIVSMDGHKIGIFYDIGLYTSEFSEKTGNVEIVVKRDGKKLKFDVKPSLSEYKVTCGEKSAEISDTMNGITETETAEYVKEVSQDIIGTSETSKRYLLGFSPKSEEITAVNIVPEAWHYTRFTVVSIFGAIRDMFSGKTGLENLSGPVGVAGVVDDAVKSGSDSLLNILLIVATLTINLGIFNLLPLPALDGGRLFFMLIELVRGKPIPPEKEGLVHTIGLILLLLLATIVCYSDIMKLFVK